MQKNVSNKGAFKPSYELFNHYLNKSAHHDALFFQRNNDQEHQNRDAEKWQTTLIS
jgi:hypothetical protein